MEENKDKRFRRTDKDGVWEYTIRYGNIYSIERLEDFKTRREFSEIKWRVHNINKQRK